LLMEDELWGKIATLLGGRAAELVVFEKISTGASDDIQKATELAEKAITQYGMSSVGPIAFAKEEGQFLHSSTTRRTVSGEVTAEIDRLVQQNINQAYEMAQKILELNRDLLESTTQTLLTQEVLEGSQLKTILAQVKSPIELPGFLQG
ncbi:MAG: ATP-dependent zinc metalloprotease FtsH, partial [Cyanobacteriota bacterium]